MSQAEMEDAAISKLMRLLANKRWGCATPAERKAQGAAMLAGRRRKARRKASK